jgi:hypothetical protein
MTNIPRSAVRAFRAVVHKGVAGRAREPAPPVVLIPDGEAVTMLVHLPSISIAYRVPTGQPGAAPMVLPMAAFEAVVGAGHDPITLEPKGKLRAELHWNDRGQGKTQAVELERFDSAHELPAEPTAFAPMPAEFLAALHEAGRTTGAANGRYALDRIQMKGKNGTVVASDGHRAYLHGGFRFPFKEDLLIPALPVFGTAELAKETDIGLGRTDTHMVVRLGPWTFYLVLDVTGRYPDVASVVPKAVAADTILEFDDLDARELLAALPKLPGGREERRPVTLDLAPGQPAVVRAHATEVVLDRSSVSKGSVRVAVDRAFLDRALRLGCRTLLVSDGKPTVARGAAVTLLTTPHEPDLIAKPRHADPTPSRALVLSEPGPETNSALEIAAQPALSEAIAVVEPAAAIDPFAEAEALRVVFVEAGQRLGRLVEWFQARRREPKVLAKVWSTLQSLKPRP